MGKRGPKPKGKIEIKWSSDFAYAVGLLAADGCLSSDGRHIDLTSKDRDQLENFLKATKSEYRITQKNSSLGDKYLRVQFSNRLFYDFLLSIGFSSAKSKTLKEIYVPTRYFFDFLRGAFDGDGWTYSYWDKRWQSSYMFYLGFASASKPFIDWLRANIKRFTGSVGHVTKDGKGATYQLKYAKRESLTVLRKMYYSRHSIFLSRKKLKIDKMLTIVGERL